MTLKIQVLIWDRHKHAVGLIRSMGSISSPLVNWTLIFNGTYRYVDNSRHALICFQLVKAYILSQNE
jgi:hypothetical protein